MREVSVTFCLGVLRQSRSFGGTDAFGADALTHCPEGDTHLLVLFASLADLPELAFAELLRDCTLDPSLSRLGKLGKPSDYAHRTVTHTFRWCAHVHRVRCMSPFVLECCGKAAALAGLIQSAPMPLRTVRKVTHLLMLFASLADLPELAFAGR